MTKKKHKSIKELKANFSKGLDKDETVIKPAEAQEYKELPNEPIVSTKPLKYEDSKIGQVLTSVIEHKESIEEYKKQILIRDENIAKLLILDKDNMELLKNANNKIIELEINLNRASEEIDTLRTARNIIQSNYQDLRRSFDIISEDLDKSRKECMIIYKNFTLKERLKILFKGKLK